MTLSAACSLILKGFSREVSVWLSSFPHIRSHLSVFRFINKCGLFLFSCIVSTNMNIIHKHLDPHLPTQHGSILQADTSMAMDTDSNVEEEAAEESRDGQEGPSPCSTYEEASTRCPSVQAVSVPSSPPGSQPGPVPGLGPDPVSLQKAGERPSSLPPSSPRALTNNDWAYHSAVCPAECQHPGMQRDKGIHTDTRRLICSPSVQIWLQV